MSVTFYPSNDWKMVERPCAICSVCEADTNDDPYCTGTRKEPDCPTVNMANGNACVMLELLGLPVDCYGDVAVESVPNVIRAIIKAQNVSTRRQDATADPYESGGPGTGQCRVIYGGRDEDYISRRLNDLMQFVQYCQENDCGFHWD